MSKKALKIHQKGPATGLYQPSRLTTASKKFGNRQTRKPKSGKK